MKLAKARAYILCLLMISSAAMFADAEVPLLPAVYLFGDSLLDVGNGQISSNNSALHYPYGIDFPNKNVTGRFSNGYNIADYIAMHLGFEMSPPPYLSVPTQLTPELMKGQGGVNYAFAGSGILDTTGTSLSKQIAFFAATKAKMSTKLNRDELECLLSESLFVINSGANDFFAYLLRNTSNIFNLMSFYDDLLTNDTKHITELYNLGARKFGILNVAPIGCTPTARALLNSSGPCVELPNVIVKCFNDFLEDHIARLSSSLTGTKYSIGRVYNIVLNFVANSSNYGFKEVQRACCGSGPFNGLGECNATSKLCANRSEYLFWDGVHPTQAADSIGAGLVFAGSTEFAVPINFTQLATGGSSVAAM